PDNAQKRAIEGRVYVKFQIDTEGQVGNVEILRSVHPDLDKEALRVVNRMPDWKPGKRKGLPVRVSYTVPLAFKLNR
ncbi:MAG: energy transducer TonB, partial [Bacteroidales bacterium]|nr:energy transducer TonB [Bacteroidales bacterium]